MSLDKCLSDGKVGEDFSFSNSEMEGDSTTSKIRLPLAHVNFDLLFILLAFYLSCLILYNKNEILSDHVNAN